MTLLRNLPNFITLLNLLSGCAGIYVCLALHELQLAAFFILLSGVFDFLDGLVARLLHAQSPIGKDLDSLADVVSFGVLPGFIAFHLLQQADPFPFYSDVIKAICCMFIPALSALRLAKFNHDTRQLSSFIGMPTPANGLFWSGMAFLWGKFRFLADFFWNPYALSFTVLVFAYALLSPIPMFSFKFSKLSWSGNELRFIFLITCMPLFLVMGLSAFAPAILLYLIFSVSQLFGKKESA